MRTSAFRTGLGLLLATSLLAACADPGASGNGPPGAVDVEEAAAEFERRADRLAASWPASGAADRWRTELVPLEPLTVLPEPAGDPADPEHAAHDAVRAGWLAADLDLDTTAPPDGEIRPRDGDPRPVPVRSAAQVWDDIHTGAPDCPTAPEPTASAPAATDPDAPVDSAAPCTVVTVTDATLDTVTIATNRGPARLPAWHFHTDDLPAPFARVAVPPAELAEVPRLDDVDFPHQPGLATAQRLVTAGDTELTYQLGIGACDNPPDPLVYETSELVVVGGTVTPEPGVDVCTDQLVLAEVTAALAAPVGQRPVLATTGEVLTFGRW